MKTDVRCNREVKKSLDKNKIQNETMDEAFKKDPMDDNTRLRKITENSENEDENKIKREDIFTDEKLILKINDGIWCWGDTAKCLLEMNDLSIHTGKYLLLYLCSTNRSQTN